MISAVEGCSYLVSREGDVYASGLNAGNWLRFDEDAKESVFNKMGRLEKICFIAAGGYYLLAIDDTGSLFGSGFSPHGELGELQPFGVENELDIKPLFRQIPIPVSLVQISVSTNRPRILAVDSESNVWAWGQGLKWQYGREGEESYLPGKLALSAIKMVQCASQHCCVLKHSGEVLSWGKNHDFELGVDTDEEPRWTPRLVPSLERIRFIQVCGRGNAALNEDGEIFIWGPLSWCQYQTPHKIENHSAGPFTNIAHGKRHLLALDENGKVWSMGEGTFGQTGTKQTKEDVLTCIPLPVSAVFVACGSYHSMIVDEFNQVWVFGYNNEGQLGIGSNINQHSPVQLDLPFELQSPNPKSRIKSTDS